MSPDTFKTILKRIFSTLIHSQTNSQNEDTSHSSTRGARHSAVSCPAGQGSPQSLPSAMVKQGRQQLQTIGVVSLLDKDKVNLSKSVPEDAQNPVVEGIHAFNNAHDFVMMNPILILSENGDKIKNVMKFLSLNIIVGAAHDDSARDPPPRCHPGTRIQLLEQITAWFYDKNRRRLVLWINGPAGVGKSAILQTFADLLAKSMNLGASVFVSRPNGRNDPRRIFITIAYQLALRIGDYRAHIVELLNLNPDIVNKDLREQFRSFITEPFVEKRIDTGGKPWCILLDGLDELEGQSHQRNIIRIISSFSRENPDIPLAWIISSRCERHITLTFNERDVHSNYLKYYLPINTTDACKDVERYLQSEFEIVRKEYPDSITEDWPPKASFLKLAATASGLFIFAETAIRFIKDPEYANPVRQLDLIISVLDHMTVPSSDKLTLFSHLDALYTQILNLIPTRSWPMTKRLFGFALVLSRSEVKGFRSFRPSSQSLRAISIIFGISQDIIYSCLTMCYSMFAIPPWTDPYDSFRFLHASFSDYLMDSTRSGRYYISISDAEDDFLLSCTNILQDFVRIHPCGLSNTHRLWDQYCAQRYPATQHINSMSISPFNQLLFQDIVGVVSSEAIDRHQPDRLRSYTSAEYSRCLDALRSICSLYLCSHFDHMQRKIFVEHIFNAWKNFSHKLVESRLVFETKLKNLYFDHLDSEKLCPTHTRSRKVQNFPYQDTCRPRSCDELRTYIDDLKRIQECLPNIQVLLCGAVMESQCALFYVDSWEFNWKRYYIIPHPRDCGQSRSPVNGIGGSSSPSKESTFSRLEVPDLAVEDEDGSDLFCESIFVNRELYNCRDLMMVPTHPRQFGV